MAGLAALWLLSPGFLLALLADWIPEDWHAFGTDYERTLQAWWGNVEAAWPELDHRRYDARFYRLWRYYLHAFMGYFRARRGQLWQLVLAPSARTQVWRRPAALPPGTRAGAPGMGQPSA